MLTSEKIKTQFLNYYSSLGHIVLPSDSLIPKTPDSTLLFINSAMARFKKMYTNELLPEHPMLAMFQRCLKVGGRPTLHGVKLELETIGRGQSLTLLEQLGTCIFGAYSRAEAFKYIWNFLTKELALEEKRFWVTVHNEDDDTYYNWKQIGIPEDRIIRQGETHWREIEPTGICGSCTLVVYDRGEYKYGCGREDCSPSCTCGRFLDLADLVFFEYRRMDGVVHQLSRLNIDSGLGLERITMIVENVPSIFEISSLRPIIRKVEELSRRSYGFNHEQDVAMRAIADHIRSLTFAISDGIHPGNEGREYVIRKILRRAVRCGWVLGIKDPFLCNLIDTAVGVMSEGYPYLADSQTTCREIVLVEEERFLKALQGNTRQFYKMARKAKFLGNYLSGHDAFELYDTYGLPLEFIEMLANEQDLKIDQLEFEKLLNEQKLRSHAAWREKVTQKVRTE